MSNKADLYQPIENTRVGPPPLVIRTIVTPHTNGLVEGAPQTARRGESYVLLSSLPEDLKRRVELSVQMHVSAG